MNGFAVRLQEADQQDKMPIRRAEAFHAIETAMTIEEIVAANGAGKGLLSEFGWAYLVNDTNDFLPLMCGSGSWSAEDRARARDVIRRRGAALDGMGVPYRKFIIPEKSAVYPEYLPEAVQALLRPDPRPAQLLQADNLDTVLYLDQRLIEVKPLGLLYFRGDTHPNWLGAWCVYRFVMERLLAEGLLGAQEPLDFNCLDGVIAAYDGDLIAQVPAEARVAFDRRYGYAVPRYGFEMTIRLGIPADRRAAARVETPPDYAAWYGTRETFVYERADGAGKRAVIFRDSTFDRGVVDLLAQHFSRSVFVWHQGLVDEDVIERERPDIVLHGMAERFVTQYPAAAPLVRMGRAPESVFNSEAV